MKLLSYIGILLLAAFTAKPMLHEKLHLVNELSCQGHCCCMHSEQLDAYSYQESEENKQQSGKAKTGINTPQEHSSKSCHNSESDIPLQDKNSENQCPSDESEHSSHQEDKGDCCGHKANDHHHCDCHMSAPVAFVLPMNLKLTATISTLEVEDHYHSNYFFMFPDIIWHPPQIA
jgi:hypothetical protein